MIGTILARRYQVIERLGGGGMALVYKGRDLLLNRTVTIKVLRDQYAGDQEFVRRFQQEAQAVARLSHPNIVSIYDVGQEGELPYLVMEYIEGKSLKEAINEEGSLELERAVNIAMQILAGLEHAHDQKIIHKDVKSQNILISPGDRVKVTDFGLAQAIDGGTVTYSKELWGSVHYISPEQAMGHVATPRSDVYSAAVVLYEMLTGRVPFEGETPVSVAMKHLREDFVPLQKLNPLVPTFLAETVHKAMAREQDDRFASAGEFRESLAKGKSRLEAARDFYPVIGDGDTLKLPQLGETNQIKKVTQRKKRRLTPGGWALVGVLVLTAIAGFWLGARNFLGVGVVTVPKVEGLALAEARDVLERAGLRWEVVARTNDAQQPEDNVLRQTPFPNEQVRRGRMVQLTLSAGPELKLLPDVTGLDRRQAVLQLTNLGFQVPEPQEVFSNDHAQGVIISQAPKGNSQQPVGSRVLLTVSKGSEPVFVAVPSLESLTLKEAQEYLRSLGLDVGRISYRESLKVGYGRVVEQSVAPGENLKQGEVVDLVLSSGASAQGGTEQSLAKVTLKVPKDDKRHAVRVVVKDELGTREAYNRSHESGEDLKQDFPFSGEGVIQVYLDDRLVVEQPVP